MCKNKLNATSGFLIQISSTEKWSLCLQFKLSLNLGKGKKISQLNTQALLKGKNLDNSMPMHLGKEKTF